MQRSSTPGYGQHRGSASGCALSFAEKRSQLTCLRRAMADPTSPSAATDRVSNHRRHRHRVRALGDSCGATEPQGTGPRRARRPISRRGEGACHQAGGGPQRVMSNGVSKTRRPNSARHRTPHPPGIRSGRLVAHQRTVRRTMCARPNPLSVGRSLRPQELKATERPMPLENSGLSAREAKSTVPLRLTARQFSRPIGASCPLNT